MRSVSFALGRFPISRALQGLEAWLLGGLQRYKWVRPEPMPSVKHSVKRLETSIPPGKCDQRMALICRSRAFASLEVFWLRHSGCFCCRRLARVCQDWGRPTVHKAVPLLLQGMVLIWIVVVTIIVIIFVMVKLHETTNKTNPSQDSARMNTIAQT